MGERGAREQAGSPAAGGPCTWGRPGLEAALPPIQKGTISWKPRNSVTPIVTPGLNRASGALPSPALSRGPRGAEMVAAVVTARLGVWGARGRARPPNPSWPGGEETPAPDPEAPPRPHTTPRPPPHPFVPPPQSRQEPHGKVPAWPPRGAAGPRPAFPAASRVLGGSGPGAGMAAAPTAQRDCAPGCWGSRAPRAAPRGGVAPSPPTPASRGRRASRALPVEARSRW
ncbi:uncharacterized protein LOC104651745 [Saimiri boliviensis]|uniref:uncharacterized protein LOC104651745 n=1 Tax=Saimiri boliviensis TaxID=27679 RepID=UPI003D77E2FC